MSKHLEMCVLGEEENACGMSHRQKIAFKHIPDYSRLFPTASDYRGYHKIISLFSKVPEINESENCLMELGILF